MSLAVVYLRTSHTVDMAYYSQQKLHIGNSDECNIIIPVGILYALEILAPLTKWST
jgi:hypothetical protein